MRRWCGVRWVIDTPGPAHTVAFSDASGGHTGALPFLPAIERWVLLSWDNHDVGDARREQL